MFNREFKKDLVKFQWNEENFNRAKELAKGGMPYSKIAIKIGTSSSSVSGKLFRDSMRNRRRKVYNKHHKRKEHETTTHFEKYGTDNCWVCKKMYITYSRFDRFCTPCKSRDYFRNAV
tara:strand:+ start:66 stop:419 length:354 start_codon:yes stop_codon:yes gene_type:complete